ncbi:precorrin-6y C5,15-methyltransferase (decarboxylating) subunit CbiE [uncultured Sulfitobacter sp.]|uniref:precorrin-6y C5,15-methyltransferase (decarboxylating) subunit CbiE n=1 Tax=uncultured Sulfitobacter sp. TaxID=191468 RepID=UPI0030DA196A|tara:strand:+ start:245479 stop:246678 length:1200 start_codon:yes stop_codon:yes gene_type:complete
MADSLWLTIIGLGEDGADGLGSASLAALAEAEIVMGAARHLDLLPKVQAERIVWPVPFADGIEQLLALRGRQVVMLASGDPFWFGAGSSMMRHLGPDEWRALPGISTFSLAASAMGWPLETTTCFGLHAVPLTRLRPALAQDVRLIVLLRDGAAVTALGDYLTTQGWGASNVSVLEALGGPRARRSDLTAADLGGAEFGHPVCAAVHVSGGGVPLPLASGRPDEFFDSDGTMTKRPVRALTLSALAPRPFQHLWDIGSGSGSIAIEWLLSDPSLSATAIELDPTRAERIVSNAAALGVDRLTVVEGAAPDVLAPLPMPDTVFVGGGLSASLLDWIYDNVPSGTRLVANAVTLESETLLMQAQSVRGGDLLRIELAQAAPLGTRRGWKSSYPIVQWSVIL